MAPAASLLLGSVQRRIIPTWPDRQSHAQTRRPQRDGTTSATAILAAITTAPVLREVRQGFHRAASSAPLLSGPVNRPIPVFVHRPPVSLTPGGTAVPAGGGRAASIVAVGRESAQRFDRVAPYTALFLGPVNALNRGQPRANASFLPPGDVTRPAIGVIAILHPASPREFTVRLDRPTPAAPFLLGVINDGVPLKRRQAPCGSAGIDPSLLTGAAPCLASGGPRPIARKDVQRLYGPAMAATLLPGAINRTVPVVIDGLTLGVASGNAPSALIVCNTLAAPSLPISTELVGRFVLVTLRTQF